MEIRKNPSGSAVRDALAIPAHLYSAPALVGHRVPECPRRFGAGHSGVFVLPMVYAACTPTTSIVIFPVQQPVQFDYRHHAGDDDCLPLLPRRGRTHAVRRGAAYKLCMGCHNPGRTRARCWSQFDGAISGRPIPWNRVHRVPDFVYFNHAVQRQPRQGRLWRFARRREDEPLSSVSGCSRWGGLDCHRQL